ncbi:TetR/AcrR family transcriptional regulator [Rhodobacter sp. SY28-1]|uniref:TetR/AcrR family transcriptional regulator n=1 Tax=Rhodobacter sp. SY28-1 TaxID=2562317 RepID=UPI0010C0F9AC|nr:TetR/AcrR family transcriptional regulator [Rhodobacter sp. SY28-1]
MGLRERHKEDRRLRILQAASALFRAQGYDAVRIEDIAAQADVSAGTCYNYFTTKGDILLSIVTLEVEEVIDAGRAVVARPPEDVASALDGLIHIYYDHSLMYLSKAMWRIAISLTISAPETPFSQRYSGLDAKLAAQVGDLLVALQHRGRVRADFDPGLIGRVIFNQLNQAFIDFCKDEAMSLETLRAESGQMTAQLARLLSPRVAAE